MKPNCDDAFVAPAATCGATKEDAVVVAVVVGCGGSTRVEDGGGDSGGGVQLQSRRR